MQGAGWGLGDKFDIAIGINLVADLAAGANTGKRVHMRNYDTLGVLLVKNVASAGTDDIVMQPQYHTANTGGSSTNWPAVNTTFYTKSGAPLAGTEAWVERSQTAASAVTIAGATFAATQLLAYFELNAGSIPAGSEWASVNIADPGAGGTILGGVLYIPHGLKISRRPDLLAQPNA